MYTPGIAIIFEDDATRTAVALACKSLFDTSAGNTGTIIGTIDPKQTLPIPSCGTQAHIDISKRAKHALSSVKKGINANILCAGNLDDMLETVSSSQIPSVDMIITTGKHDGSTSELLEQFFDSVTSLGKSSLRTPLSTVVYDESTPTLQGVINANADVIEQYMPKERWPVISQTVMNVTEYLITNHCNAFMARRIRGSDAKDKMLKTPKSYGKIKVSLADALTDKLDLENSKDWMFGYFTGSVVAPFIQHVTNKCSNTDVTIISGTNEHHLACSAMANWQLHQSPFLIAVTCGMMMEFKGTLLNLKRTRAKGFIVCGEGEPSSWYAAQGMLNDDENVFKMLDAWGISYVYLEEPDNMEEGIQQAVDLYNTATGPVVIIATPRCYDASRPVSIDFTKEPKAESLKVEADPESIAAVVDIINDQKKKILCVVDAPLTQAERSLLNQICDIAGVAVADSVQRPGAVSKYNLDGEINKHYLGTLGVYGTSPGVYDLLFSKGKLNPTDEQSIFFLKSKMGQPSSPFVSGSFGTKVHTIQVNNDKKHIAPYADIAIVENLESFLNKVIDKLCVGNEIKAYREAQLLRSKQATAGPLAQIPTSPMSPNYFFGQLSELLDRLITQNKYTYTGVFDAGRCAFSAVRNLPRTNVGFSSVYGRGNMGDAMLATPLIALKNKGNTLAFVGDGAKGVVPDVLPAILKNLHGEAQTIEGNVTIFVFVNKTMSMIRTYQERGLYSESGVQMHNPQLAPQEKFLDYRGVEVNMETLFEWNEETVEDIISKPKSVNIVHVMTSHDSWGDIYEHLDDSWFKTTSVAK